MCVLAARWGSVLPLVLMLSAPALPAPPPQFAEAFDFSRRRLTAKQVAPLSLHQLRLMRGIIFGRHGRVFREKDIQGYLKSRSWYRPNPRFSLGSLGQLERYNLDVIRFAEARRHRYVEPGDMRIYRDKVLPANRLRNYSLPELRILSGEIEAIHGRRFADEPWLQNYFNQRYWYRPGDFKPAMLSVSERRNLEILAALEKKRRNLRLSPGQMGAFQHQLINDKMLRGLSLYELRLLRNEIYARRGKKFRTQWLAMHYSFASWYKPRSDYAEPPLSDPEQKNVDTIVHLERRLHDDLSRRRLEPYLLKDLPLEDARKLRTEIYARRGRRFKDMMLQDYFESLPWYRPRADFRMASLSGVERRNERLIRAHEERLEALASQVEA